MHLKLASEGTIDDGEIARDLGQQTADIVILSAADSDLATFAAAHAKLPADFPSIQLTNLLALGHPASVDLYVERTLRAAKIVLLRMLGGEGYWPYGVDSLRSDALRRDSAFACIPGEHTWNPDLAARGTLPLPQTETLWRYCTEGGIDNATHALQFAAHLIGHGALPPQPRPMPAAGFWGNPPTDARPRAAIIFYRALASSADTAPVDALANALDTRGVSPVCLYVTSLKDARSTAFVKTALAAHPPDIIINATAFATATAGNDDGVLAAFDCPVLQVAFAGSSRNHWEQSARGLNPRDLAMHVVLPEVDGRIFSRAVAFKERAPAPSGFAPTLLKEVPDRIEATAEHAAAWINLRRLQPGGRKVAIVLANYPNRDGRLANGVGLDTPQSLSGLLQAMRAAGYAIEAAPNDAPTMMSLLQRGPTNALDNRVARVGGVSWPVDAYAQAFARMPQTLRDAVVARWGTPAEDPHVEAGAFRFGLHRFGNAVVGIQPARGYNIDPKSTYHDPDLIPPHHYLAFYLWLRHAFGIHAIVHLGKHGNLEWLPGKSTGLAQDCAPDAILGSLPHLYPFIVNDPGEGIQAKRRTAAVIVDHLTPALTRAELHDDLARLEAMVDEYALAADLDPRRAAIIADDIVSLARAMQIDSDLNLARNTSTTETLRALDAHLCDLKEMQIRDGLHVFGRAPEGRQQTDLLVSIARVPRSDMRREDGSLHRAIAADLGLTGFDPLDRNLADDYTGPRPSVLQRVLPRPIWRTNGDTVERIEALAAELVAGTTPVHPAWTGTNAILAWIDTTLRPAVTCSGTRETAALLHGLNGGFVTPGPAGAPTRGRPDVLPTGRNFFAVDTRAVPTPSAWRIGKLTAERLIEAYWQETGDWPRSIALSAWGTANMRTGGDDVAQALALIGAQPQWEPGTGRITGFTIIPLSELGRPRIDLTLRVSGLFRDAFPAQMDLIDSAVRAIAALNEPDDANPLAAHVRATRRKLAAAGMAHDEAERRASLRVFGAKPGAYGAGLQALIDEGGWQSRADLADSYLAWSSYAYGGGAEGTNARDLLSERLASIEVVAQAQDNREHDILDSDDYYQFMGGLASTVETLRGAAPRVIHLDTSRAETPVARSLSHEISRVVRGRAANPKWIDGIMRHGYKGAFEIAATVDYLFGFAASTDAVGNHHFDQLFSAFIENERVRTFMAEANPAALNETALRFQEAVRRGLWRPRSNSATDLLAALTIRQTVKEAIA
ncbi:cobaltochelatase [Afipia sp. P52-10]|uniref:cobaltochelatase subunit CobN n=1 Tax=Afipia sp. P52-10 TaxID=1429916 RepID=UPI0003DEF6B8|nr:cobaltochelatase subunit CobN [Afipia sp. P52-10]ETR76260.1 cobaltochelatase [Afipia sp. P52-10]